VDTVRRVGLHLSLPILSGLLLGLSFPRFDLSFLAWIALVPLLFAVREQSWSAAFGQGFLAGLVFFAGTLSWVVNAMHLYGKLPLVISYAVMLLLAAYCALYMALFTGLASAMTDARDAVQVWLLPALWVALELARTHLFSGFPWALLGYSQYEHLVLIQVADITGVYGISFLVVLGNVVLARITARMIPATAVSPPAPWITAAVAMALVLGVHAYGLWRLALLSELSTETAPQRTVRIGLVQANVDQAQKWDVTFRRETIDRYKRLTTQAARNADLVVWPEAATPFIFQVEADYRRELLDFVRDQGVPLLFGSPATVLDPTSNQLRLLNSAFLVTGDGVVTDRYDKIHLVPFGEYVPLKDVFTFVDKLVVGIGDFLPGNRPDVMTGPGGRFGVVICFEVIFPDLVRRFVEQGADYMITITNDAWFGRSSAPYQHFSMVVFRAVENRVAFARAANTGISGFIDASGRILRMSDIFVEEALTGEIGIGGPRAFYTAYGDVFAYGCVILSTFGIIAIRRRGIIAARRSRRATSSRRNHAR
jgi:apolipoprotein N-acyltransferase